MAVKQVSVCVHVILLFYTVWRHRFADVRLTCTLYIQYNTVGVSCVVVKTEACSGDITNCPEYDVEKYRCVCFLPCSIFREVIFP